MSKNSPKAVPLPLSSLSRSVRVRASLQEVTAAPVVARQQTIAATTALSMMAAANPAMAGDLFGPEYAGAVQNVALFIVVGTGAVAALLLPIITGTLNPVQMAINLGIVEGEVSNLRKFKNNGRESFYSFFVPSRCFVTLKKKKKTFRRGQTLFRKHAS